MSVAVIGGGLAGSACAYFLSKAGKKVTLYESSKSLALGASGNILGLYNPRISAHRTSESDFYSSGFSLALRVFKELQSKKNIDFNPCGALHLITNEKREKRYYQTVENWGWEEEFLKIIPKEKASEIAGVKIKYDALYMPYSGFVSPKKLCTAYTNSEDIKIIYESSIKSLSDILSKHESVILACGLSVLDFKEASWLPLKHVRGQVSYIQAEKQSEKLKTALCYGGYCTPSLNNQHMIGSTFQRWLSHSNVLEEDDLDNIQNFQNHVCGVLKDFKVIGNRASVRTTSKDHFPIIGPLPGIENVYISTAHGSHGIISSLAGAVLLTDYILQRPFSQSYATKELLKPNRFQNIS